MADDRLAAFLAAHMDKAEKATPGKRLWHKSGVLHVEGSGGYTFGEAVLSPTWEYDEGTDIKGKPEDLDFTAAFDPEVCKALLRVAEAASAIDENWCSGSRGECQRAPCPAHRVILELGDLRRLAEERAE